MLAKTYSYGILGLDAFLVQIEVDVSHGLPSTTIVGLPDSAIRESKERVRSAIKNNGYQFTPERITINLAPADIKKEGPSFDLAVALGILAATGQIDGTPLDRYVILGELSLDGRIRAIKGALSTAMAVPKNKFAGIILPVENAPEAALTDATAIYPVKTLAEVVLFLQQPDAVVPFKMNKTSTIRQLNRYDVDFSDVKGQFHAKRGLEVTAAGGHNALLVGPPGSGKTMLARRLPTILPDMTVEEALETTKIHSVMGLLDPKRGIAPTRPFRTPHHTASDIALVGGGSIPRPGEVTLSHNGILFLDETPEFNRNVLEALRQPLEDANVTVSRANKSLRFPSKFMLVCAMNPCMCGHYGHPRVACRCTSFQIQKYRSKISGPLLDRIDIHLDVPAISFPELTVAVPTENSAQIKKRVDQARAVQQERFKGLDTTSNARMSHKQVRTFCVLGKDESALLKQAMTELNFSARAHDKILKLSRTIADLAGAERIQAEHLAEAIQYRNLDRDWWS